MRNTGTTKVGLYKCMIIGGRSSMVKCKKLGIYKKYASVGTRPEVLACEFLVRRSCVNATYSHRIIGITVDESSKLEHKENREKHI